MRHALAYESVGSCQICDEPLTSRDVLETGQARLCPACYQTAAASAFSWSKNEPRRIAEAR